MAENIQDRPIAVQVTGVKKMYKLGQIGGGSLQKDLQSWWAKKRGKEDPNTIIGEGERSHGDTFMALNGVDLTIYQGEAVGIIGSNGAGKSTLLKLLSRVTAPTEGVIDIYGRIASMLEVGTGFNPEMTGRENVYLNGAILGMTKAEIDAKMEQIIEFSEVREFIDTPVKRYSSGMFVKLAFSVAAHLDAEIMIMDEVLAVGDMAFQTKCLDKMREAANAEGRTVLYVSHNMNTIERLCDRCIVLDKGKIVYDGSVDNAINVYLGGKIRMDVVRDFSSNRIKKYNTDGKIQIKKVLLRNKTYPVFSENEVIRFGVVFDALEYFDDLLFRVSIQSELFEVIGLSVLSRKLIIESGCCTVDFSLDVNCLAPGKYILKLVAYSNNEYGSVELHDVIDDAIIFEKKDSDASNIKWEHKYWGFTRFPNLMVLE